MNSLQSLQSSFQQSIVNADQDVIEQLVGTDHAPAEARLGIYQEAYRLRLIEALVETYRGVRALLGEAAFDRLCRGYIDTHPSRHYSIRWYGDLMAEYLTRSAAYRSKECLKEMVQWEWKLSLAFDAPSTAVLDEKAMQAIPANQWAKLRLEFHPSLQRLDLAWSVPHFRQQVEEEHADIAPPRRAEQPSAWLIWRPGLQQKYRSLEMDEAWALDRALRGENFANLCEGLCEWIDPQHAPMRAASLLKGWLQEKLVTAVRTA